MHTGTMKRLGSFAARAAPPWSAILVALCGVPAIAVAADPAVNVLKPPSNASTEDKNKNKKCRPAEPILQSYEPLTGGYTHDSNDTGFFDANLSLKIRLLPWCLTPSWVHPYFAMATRFGFYWGSRPNSPVIGKSYNPLILIRFLPKQADPIWSTGEHYGERREYIDLIPYAHQSNGQLIHTQQQYDAELDSLKIASYTDNFIHRGWDYAGVLWKNSWGDTDIASYLEGRYFIPVGFLQGPEDQYHSWENNPQGKPRDAVDGLSAMIEYPSSYAHFAIDPSDDDCQRPNEIRRYVCLLRLNLTVKYLTGYNTPFKFSTERVELGFQVLTLPLAAWMQHGYMSSLAMYYEKVTSVGIEVRFESF